MYKLEYLPLAVSDILEIEDYLYEYSTAAADKFAHNIERLTKTLSHYPLMYPVYADDHHFRHMVLPYNFILFYHVDEQSKTIRVHRVLHGMRDVRGIIAAEE